MSQDEILAILRFQNGEKTKKSSSKKRLTREELEKQVENMKHG